MFSVCMPSAACGPYSIVAFFWLPRDPGPTLEQFLAGHLGILDHGQRAPYLYIAYRHLTGLDMDADNQQALTSLWPQNHLASVPDPNQAWREARQRVPDLESPGWISTTRSQSVEENGTVTHNYFLNCLGDAFGNAAKTLTARIDRFGAGSPEVRAWVEAQEQVFANCSSGETIPQPLGAEWDPLIRWDRQYQIAAAHFYATHYPQAVQRFREISRDPDSPWRDLAAYLIARALIRDGQFNAANQELERILAAPRLDEWHEPARRLLAFSRLRGAPAGRLEELTRQLLATRLEAPLRQNLTDYLWLLDHDQGDSTLRDWMQTMRLLMDEPAPAPAVALELPVGLPRLTAALVTATGDTPGLEVLLAAATEISSDSPAFLTTAYHRSRLLVATGRLEEARTTLDWILNDSPAELSAADQNRLRLLRAEITPELDDYLRLVALEPLGLGWDDGSSTVPGNPVSVFPTYRLGQPLIPDSAVELLNHGLHTTELLRLVEGDVLPDPWRKRLTLATWTRAVVIGEDKIARAIAPLVSTLAPELADEMTAYLEAGPEDRQFAAVWTLLRFPGLSPVLRWNVGRRTPVGERDSLRDNGWCADVLAQHELPKQIVRDADQIDAVHASWPSEGRIPASPDYLGRLVLSRAENHPEDSRLAEALHRVVEATRYGCGFGGYGEMSRAAFQLLHQRFPDSPWAEQTPYWFDS